MRSPHGASCRGHRRCRPALPLRFVATGWWWWCDSWCRTGQPSWRQTAAYKICQSPKTERIHFLLRCTPLTHMRCFTVRAPKGSAVTHQPSLRFDERSVDAIHLVVQSAGIAQIVASPIPPPEGGRHRPAVHTLSTLSKVIEQV